MLELVSLRNMLYNSQGGYTNCSVFELDTRNSSSCAITRVALSTLKSHVKGFTASLYYRLIHVSDRSPAPRGFLSRKSSCSSINGSRAAGRSSERTDNSVRSHGRGINS